MSKKGLVLEGGAMRGMYTAGVMDVLMENEYEFEKIVGVSAGAAFGCNYKSKQIGRVIRYNLEYCGDPRLGGIKSLIETGDLYNVEFAYHTLPNELDVFDGETFAANPSEFFVVTTNVETGKPHYQLLASGTDEDVEWIRASASMPGVSNPVAIGDGLHLDGGIADPIPLKWMLQKQVAKNIVVLTRPEGYIKPKANKPVTKVMLKNYPNLASSMLNRHKVYNQSVEYCELQEHLGNALIIRPSKDLGLKRTEKDPEKLQAMYDLGRSDAIQKLDQIKQFFEN
ncbi:patatin family protein [Mollicutes bacterium LVI A0078]|nr:patatin family protein [Mollicutes bacterium LVI A0075]WOO90718.1 patatin family protein [Mollicutes bacterium LVI A0078]